MSKGLLMAVGITFLFTPISLFACTGITNADGPFAYPGPYGPYEKDIVTVGCAQIQPVYGDTATTFDKMHEYVIQAEEKGIDILVFPEMVLNNCMRGDEKCNKAEMAETLPGPSSQEMEKLAAQYGMYIVYGFLERDQADASKIYNTAAVLGPEGLIGKYRKIHPVPWLEDVERGREPFAFDTPWGPIGVGICWDNYMYPELARTYGLMGCRLMLNPTAITFAAGQDEMMMHALICRYAENMMFVASANRVKSRGEQADAGQSSIIGPTRMHYEPTFYAGPASDSEEELIVATLNLEEAELMRIPSCIYDINPRLKEPSFLPQMWAELWGNADDELEIANQEIEELRVDKQALIIQNEQTTRNFHIAIAVAGLLLITTIAFAVISFSRKKK